jgi:tripartite-type tricarboxylate transporter receptor subunit TctC
MRGGLAGLLIASACCIAHAQAPFPNRPIRLIVTSPAGGANDVLNRTLARDTGVRRKTRMKAGNHVAPARHGLQLRFSLRAQGS